MTHKQLRRWLWTALWSLVAAPGVASAQGSHTFTFTPIDYPGSSWTMVNGINAAGTIVGSRQGYIGIGFSLTGTTFTDIINPFDATNTFPRAISDLNVIVGGIGPYGGSAFVRSTAGDFMRFWYPNSSAPAGAYTDAWAVNAAGEIVGWYYDAIGPKHGFLCSTGHFVDPDPSGYQDNLYVCDTHQGIDYPGAVSTYPLGINNNGDIVGYYTESGGGARGFLFVRSAGQFVPVDYPGADLTYPRGVNNLGQIVGDFVEVGGGSANRGFLKDGAAFATIDFPASLGTQPNGINDAGVIVGTYTDATYQEHGFSATFTTHPLVSLDPATVTFASQPVTTTSPPQTVTLSNTGAATLDITSITMTGDFSQDNACGSSLAAGASCTINLRFTPVAAGLRSGSLSVSSDATGSPHTVSLSGTGAAQQILVCGQVVQGSIAVPLEQDIFGFAAQQGDVVRIALGTTAIVDSGFEVAAEVYGTDGVRLWELTGTADVGPLPASGTYTIVVRDYWRYGDTQRGSYALGLEWLSPVGRRCDTTGLACGQVVQGSIAVPLEQDIFSFAAQQGDVLRVALGTTAIVDSGFEVAAEVYGTGGVRLWELTGTADVGPLPASGTYTLVVRDYWRYGDTQRGSYALGLEWLSPVGRRCDTTGLACGQVVQGSIAVVEEHDLFTFSGQQGDVLRVALGTTAIVDSGFEVVAEVYGADGVRLSELTGTADVGPLPVSGTYTIVVRDYWRYGDTQRGSYALGLEWLSPVGRRCDTMVLVCGQVVQGSIAVVEEHDVFTFSGQQGDVLRVALGTTAIVDSGFEVVAEVYGADGVRLSELTGTADVGPLPVSGTYTIVVRDYWRYGDTQRGSYSLGLYSISPPACGIVDNDGDQLPDDWELQLGLDPASSDGDNGADGDPDGDGPTNLQEYQEGTHPRGFYTRYFAEGATISPFDTRFALANSNSTEAAVLLRFLRRDGQAYTHVLPVPALSRRTVDAKSVAGLEAAEFSTVVEADVRVIVDRTMSWGPDHNAAHTETSVTQPATTWYLAEGATHWTFDLFYTIQNANASAATVTVRYLLPGGQAPIDKTYSVPANSRFNIWVDQEEFPAGSGNRLLAATDVSARITSDLPIIVERSMYMSTPTQMFRAGHNSAGVTAPALNWFLSEGATGSYFDLFVLLANPNDVAAVVRGTYLLPAGATITKDYTVPANSRFNIWVDYEDPALADTAVSTTMESLNGVPIIVERAMWWPGPSSATWAEAHDAAGSTATGTMWALAEGEQGGAGNAETYITIANVSQFTGQARVTLLFEDGSPPVETTVSLPASSRTNVWPPGDFGGSFPAGSHRRFGAIIESLGATPAQLVVEHPMYWDANGVRWAAGTNALGTRLQ